MLRAILAIVILAALTSCETMNDHQKNALTDAVVSQGVKITDALIDRYITDSEVEGLTNQ